MKGSGVIRLMAIAAVVLFTQSNIYSQSVFTGGSMSGSAKSFSFRGTVEGVVNDLATINFSILKEGTASLVVLDSKGETISELISGELGPGDYTVYYKPVPETEAGEYFLQFDMNGERICERFLMARNQNNISY